MDQQRPKTLRSLLSLPTQSVLPCQKMKHRCPGSYYVRMSYLYVYVRSFCFCLVRVDVVPPHHTHCCNDCWYGMSSDWKEDEWSVILKLNMMFSAYHTLNQSCQTRQSLMLPEDLHKYRSSLMQCLVHYHFFIMQRILTPPNTVEVGVHAYDAITVIKEVNKAKF